MAYGAPASNAFRCHSGVGSNCVPIFIQHYTPASPMAPSPSSPPTWFARAPSAAHLLFSPGTSNPGFLTHQGLAYSKHLVHTYVSLDGSDIQQHFEIDAHYGGVNGLAFAIPMGKISLITCGDDKNIRIWDASNGAKLIDLVGHEAPVYSAFPLHRHDTHFILSTSIDGKINVWLYDVMGPRIEYTTPNSGFFSMAYSADGRRLFSFGTSKEGESYIAEWNEGDGGLRRTYQGLNKRALSVVYFDISKNWYLAAGDDHCIKYWDIDSANILATFDADGGLPANPCMRFNKDGSLLAVSSEDKGFKVLANIEGCQLLYKNDAKIPAATQIEPEVEMQARVFPMLFSFDDERFWT